MLNPVSNSTKKYNFKCGPSSADNSDQFQDNSQNPLNNLLNPVNNHGYLCACVECRPIGNDHENFMSDMPDDPVEIISDFSRMGLIKNQAYEVADAISTAEMRDLLFYKNASNGDPYKEKLLRELAKEAGGLDQAFRAAFGPQAGKFFANTRASSPMGRRAFLSSLAAGAALITVACSNQNKPTKQPIDDTPININNLEKQTLRVGFIPITCASPIIMAEPMGFYNKFGMDVKVVKMPSWGAVRDSAIAGELDAYHMLAPMPISMTLGLGTSPFSVKLASIENINGQAITVANRHKGKVKGPADMKGFIFGVPFPYSMHNLLLRYYLAKGGVDPDKDVQIRPVPPPDSIAQLVAGDIDAYLMPDPFNQRAVYEDAGFIHLLTKELWPGHPCCAFAAGEPWINEHPETFRALNKSIIDAAAYVSTPSNRKEVAKAISGRGFLNQPTEVVEAVLTGKFEDGLGRTQNVPDRIDFKPYPWQSFSHWIQSQLIRWDLGGAVAAIQAGDFNPNSASIFLTDEAQALEREMGGNPPTARFRKEVLAYDEFDPSNPIKYVKDQIKRDGF